MTTTQTLSQHDSDLREQHSRGKCNHGCCERCNSHKNVLAWLTSCQCAQIRAGR